MKTADRQGADHYIFLSRTHKVPKDPLPYADKATIFKRMFPYARLWEDTATTVRTPYEAMETLAQRYSHLIFVVGSDRVAEFTKMASYAEQAGAKSFRILSAGERDPDAEGVEGMSASKARALAASGDFEAFAQALPDTVSTTFKKGVYRLLRREMKI